MLRYSKSHSLLLAAILTLLLLAACSIPPPQTAGPEPAAAPASQEAMASNPAAEESMQEEVEASTPPSTEPIPTLAPSEGLDTKTSEAGASTTEAPAGVDGLLFSDQTEAAGVSFTHATPITSGDGAQMISGAAAGDFNNDGWVDLYVIGGGLNADALFINQGDGTFVDMAEAAGLAQPHLGSGAAVGDYNNDGWDDIFVTSFGTLGNMGPGHHRLYRNNGDGTFSDVAAEAGVNFASPELPDGLGAAFGDYDLDGYLDLFVAGWRKPGGEPALGNRLFHNNGDGTFDEVTAAAGIVDKGIRGFSPCFADMNDDWYPELLVGADFGTSAYFVNNTDGTFSESTHEAGVNFTWSGMGSAVGDVNQDGRLDWFLTAIYDDDAVGRGDGNKLYLNQGSNEFEEVAIARGVADGGWGWGADIVDLNNDTLPDIIHVNGWDLRAYLDEPGKVFLQQADGSFIESGVNVGFGKPVNALGLFTLDYDNDGDMDVVTTAFNDALHLYRNDLNRPDEHWLRLWLDTSGAPGLAPQGLGSRVALTIGDKTFYRTQNGCSHYLTQSELALHFGLGSATSVDELVVQWPNGSETRLADVAADQVLTIRPE